jgi:hypothetical protein
VSGVASADDDRRWIGETFAGGASLIYGTPESDGVGISLVCDIATHQLRLAVMLGPEFKPRQGTAVVKVTAPPTSESWSASGSLAVLEGFDDTVLEATGRFDVPLARMLKQGKALVVTIGKKSFEFPLKGATAAMGAIEAACAAPR